MTAPVKRLRSFFERNYNAQKEKANPRTYNQARSNDQGLL